ncbi:hypothetical protein KJ652_01920 [Patescibacteria group bacterium]|nr:hypothetical protein [Patescibacteria group bacterium]MBU1123322.1 hypothetical protein [Patescibacteria group bacterium]
MFFDSIGWKGTTMEIEKKFRHYTFISTGIVVATILAVVALRSSPGPVDAVTAIAELYQAAKVIAIPFFTIFFVGITLYLCREKVMNSGCEGRGQYAIIAMVTGTLALLSISFLVMFWLGI